MGPEHPCTFLLGMQGSDCSLPTPFLRAVFIVSNLEGWNAMKSGICFKIIGQGEELSERIDETILSKNL